MHKKTYTYNEALLQFFSESYFKQSEEPRPYRIKAVIYSDGLAWWLDTWTGELLPREKMEWERA